MRVWWMPCEATAVSLPDNSQSTWSSRPTEISSSQICSTSLCLYRVVQEALRNIAKHADARQVHVTVGRVEEGVQLAVTDDGNGFNLAKAREQNGLGLRSIEERIRLVGWATLDRHRAAHGHHHHSLGQSSRISRSRACQGLTV